MLNKKILCNFPMGEDEYTSILESDLAYLTYEMSFIEKGFNHIQLVDQGNDKYFGMFYSEYGPEFAFQLDAHVPFEDLIGNHMVISRNARSVLLFVPNSHSFIVNLVDSLEQDNIDGTIMISDERVDAKVYHSIDYSKYEHMDMFTVASKLSEFGVCPVDER